MNGYLKTTQIEINHLTSSSAKNILLKFIITKIVYREAKKVHNYC